MRVAGLILSLLFLPGFLSAATVTSITETDGISFGSIDPGAVSGTIKSNGTITGTLKSFSSTQNASFLVSGENNTNTTFRVFLIGASTTLANGGNNMAAEFSLDQSSSVTTQDYDFASGAGAKTLSINVYGTLTATNGQVQGNYSGSYTALACACDENGCPSSTGDPRCS